jgi:hypothetical protein
MDIVLGKQFKLVEVVYLMLLANYPFFDRQEARLPDSSSAVEGGR